MSGVATPFRLKFTVGPRVLLSIPIKATTHNAFGRGGIAHVREVIAQPGPGRTEAQVFRSVEAAPADVFSVEEPSSLLYVLQSYMRYRIDLRGDFEDLLEGLSSRTRSTLRRKVRKFERANDGQVDWRCYQDFESIKEFFSLASPLVEKTYQATRLDGALPTTKEFESRALGLASQGLVRAYLLFLHDKPIAYLYAPVSGDSLIYAYLGYDPACRSLSPGTVLQYHVHRALFAEKPCRYFDFTEGEGDHKKLFANQCHECIDLLCVPRSLRWRCTLAMHRTWNSFVVGSRSVVERSGFLPFLRRKLR